MLPRSTVRLGTRSALFRRASVHAEFAKHLPKDMERKQMNLFTAINSALDVALQTDKTYFGVT